MNRIPRDVLRIILESDNLNHHNIESSSRVSKNFREEIMTNPKLMRKVYLTRLRRTVKPFIFDMLVRSGYQWNDIGYEYKKDTLLQLLSTRSLTFLDMVRTEYGSMYQMAVDALYILHDYLNSIVMDNHQGEFLNRVYRGDAIDSAHIDILIAHRDEFYKFVSDPLCVLRGGFEFLNDLESSPSVSDIIQLAIHRKKAMVRYWLKHLNR